MKAKIILSRPVLSEGMELLEDHFQVILASEKKGPLLEVVKQHQDAAALISFLSDSIDSGFIRLARHLQIISNYAVGFNNIDTLEAAKAGIPVTNTPEVLTDATADLAWALILSSARRIVESDSLVRNFRFHGWNATLMLGTHLSGKTLGIVGLGRIGLATALRARGFQMKVIYYSRTRKVDLEDRYGFQFRDLDSLIREAQVVSLHLSYSGRLRHLFDRHRFSIMRRDAVLVNVSRGPVINEQDLADHLEENPGFRAGLDVYEFEPRIIPKLLSLPNVTLTPHTGSATRRARLDMVKTNLRDIQAALRGERPPHRIN